MSRKPRPPKIPFTLEQRQAAQMWLMKHRTLSLPDTLVAADECHPHTLEHRFTAAKAAIDRRISESLPPTLLRENVLGKRAQIWQQIDWALQIFVGQRNRPADLIAVRKSLETIALLSRDFYLMIHGEGLSKVSEPPELWNFLANVASHEAFDDAQLSPLLGLSDIPNAKYYADLREARASRERAFRAVASREALSEAMLRLGHAARMAAELMPRTNAANWPTRELGRAVAAIWERLTSTKPSGRNDKGDLDGEDHQFEVFAGEVVRLLPPEHAEGFQSIHSFAKTGRTDWRKWTEAMGKRLAAQKEG